MTIPAVTAGPFLPLPSAVRLFDEPAVTIVAVTVADRIIGTLRRRDVVQRLIAAPPARVRRPDAELPAEMEARMRDEPWLPTSRPVVRVEDCVVRLWGLVDSQAQKAGLETMARAIPGVGGWRATWSRGGRCLVARDLTEAELERFEGGGQWPRGWCA